MMSSCFLTIRRSSQCILVFLDKGFRFQLPFVATLIVLLFMFMINVVLLVELPQVTL